MAGIYFHIPFCHHKCSYCNFYSIASKKWLDQIAEALLKELVLRRDELGGTVETIYFGGGTPSLLTAVEVESLLQAVYDNFRVAKKAEITFEANPDDLSEDYLNALKRIGVNRISIGIQSFQQNDLAYLERRHHSEMIPGVLQRIFQTGFEQVNADIIYGIPGQTEEHLRENIQSLVSYPLDHISAYALTVEQGTALNNQIQKGKKAGVRDEVAAEHFLFVSEQLQSLGFEHYEISNYALPNHYAKHNTNYWFQKPYLGIGPAAHSFNGVKRRWNKASVHHYIHGLEKNTLDYEEETLNQIQQFNEFIMLRIRTQWGVDMQALAERFSWRWHNDLIKQLKQLHKPDLITYNRKENRIKLSQKGFLYADGLASELFRADTD